MAAATGQATQVSNCPFGLTMFEDGIKGAEVERQDFESRSATIRICWQETGAVKFIHAQANRALTDCSQHRQKKWADN